jgi:hypothetical protein
MFRRRGLVVGAVVGASVASNRAAARQQEQMYQQQTQQQVAKAQADAADAQREVQDLKNQQHQQPQVVYVATEAAPVAQAVYPVPNTNQPSSHMQTPLPLPPPAIQPQQQLILLELFCPHIVDEESPAIKPHNIISVPQGGQVHLVAGSLAEGLPAPYGDYILVNYNGKVGKISRLVVRKVESG